MKANARCTVLMPLYNKEKYIETAIKSVLNQSLAHCIELVIADDCSTDGSLKIAQKYGELYSDIITVLTSEKNRGLLANDIRVYENMKTEYFCVLDPDDYWTDNDFLQRAVNFLDENRDFVCYGANTVLNDEGKDIGVYIPTDRKQYVTNSIEDYLEGAIRGQVIVPHTTAAVYRNVIFKNGVPEIIRNAVGTISEASFRADHDRFVIHLKYGKAIFVNDLVAVYRMTKEGIWSGAKQIHKDLLDAQAKFDYSAFYDDIYWEKFRETAKPYYVRILKEKISMLQRGEAMSPDDAMIFQNVEREFKKEGNINMEKHMQGGTFSDLENRLNNIENFLRHGLEKQQELIWANIFHDTIRGSEWMLPNLALSPGRWALGYPGLYALYRTLDELKPLSILELGLGQSTKIIGSYVNYMNKKGYECRHCVVEHDKNWIDFFVSNNNIKETEIIQLDMEEVEFNIEGIGKTGVNIYVGFQQRLQGRKFDMIFIDAPLGSEEYSRIDVANILPDCLSEQFVLMMDDCERKGEIRGLQLIESILQENQIAYGRGIYQGEKATILLVSKGRLDFLTSI